MTSTKSEGVRANTLLTVEDLGKYYPARRNLLNSRRERASRITPKPSESSSIQNEPKTSDTSERRSSTFVKAVDGVSFSIRESEIFALVGESGCGKTTIAKMIVGLLKPTKGRILLFDQELDPGNRKKLKLTRRNVQIIFQDPYSSLDPSMKIGRSISEPLISYGFPKEERRAKVEKLLTEVGLRPEDAERRPREFSGGQRQRIAIARALALDPQLIVADEPVSALDISVRAQILNLLLDLRDRKKISFLIIAHDLSIVRHVADRIAVMHLGKIVELADNNGFFQKPLHPYSIALLDAVPNPDPTHREERPVLKGELPSPIDPPEGCRFHTRCPKKFEPCDKIDPQLAEYDSGHYVACHLYPGS